LSGLFLVITSNNQRTHQTYGKDIFEKSIHKSCFDKSNNLVGKITNYITFMGGFIINVKGILTVENSSRNITNERLFHHSGCH